MKTNMQEASVVAFHAHNYDTQAARIASIIAVCDTDITGGEIQAEYERLYKRIEAGTVSARVNKMVTDGDVIRKESMRKCKHSGRMAHPVHAQPVQKALF
jgi:hypothetical protein